MYNARSKILKQTGKTETEEEIAKIIYDLEMKDNPDLHHLYITDAEHIEFTDRAGRPAKALLIKIPYRSMPYLNQARATVMSALEKKFRGSTVILTANRRILSKHQKARKGQDRPRTRTLTSVHDAWLEEVVAPAHIAAKHTRLTAAGQRVIKVFLDPLDRDEIEDKLDAIAETYRRLTHKRIVFDFAKPTAFQKLMIAHRQNS